MLNIVFCCVLIESDWNLKTAKYGLSASTPGINRIRLEFKGCRFASWYWCYLVLIESDWNLKSFPSLPVTATAGINRIRLEFKARKFRGLRS